MSKRVILTCDICGASDNKDTDLAIFKVSYVTTTLLKISNNTLESVDADIDHICKNCHVDSYPGLSETDSGELVMGNTLRKQIRDLITTYED